MPMNVEITFTGDVIISEQPYGWEIVAVTDAEHVAKLSSNLDPLLDADMRNALKQRTVRFEHDIVVPKSTDAANLWAKLLNISAADMHGVDPKTNQTNLVGAWLPDGRNEIVRFIIPTGTASVPTTVPSYWIEEYGNPSSRFIRELPTATSVMFSFTINGGRGLKRIVDDNAVLTTSEFTYAEGSTLSISIDNDCHGGSGSMEDFLRYYAYLREHDPQGGIQRRFICGKNYGADNESGEHVEQVPDASGKFYSPFGNCDPVGSDPPLWP